MIAGFKSIYPPSVADAVELVTAKNGRMRYPFIRQFKSLSKAIAKFKRI